MQKIKKYIGTFVKTQSKITVDFSQNSIEFDEITGNGKRIGTAYYGVDLTRIKKAGMLEDNNVCAVLRKYLKEYFHINKKIYQLQIIRSKTI